MITSIVFGVAVTVIVVIFAAVFAKDTRRRENRFTNSADPGAASWIAAGGGGGDCDAGATGDAGCGDGGGGD